MTIAESPAITEMLTTIESDAGTRGWDNPASLYVISVEPLAGDFGAMTAMGFPGFDSAIKGTGHCFHALTAINEVIATSGPESVAALRAALHGMIGLVLVDEAWTLRIKPGEQRPSGSFADHPDRIEQRFAWFMGVDGSTKTVSRERGGQLVTGQWREGRLVGVMTELISKVATR